MHLLALALFWFWFKGRFVQIDVDTALDVSRTHRGLAIAGGTVIAAGIALIALVAGNWEYLKGRREDHGRGAEQCRCRRVLAIGLALTYASRARKDH